MTAPLLWWSTRRWQWQSKCESPVWDRREVPWLEEVQTSCCQISTRQHVHIACEWISWRIGTYQQAQVSRACAVNSNLLCTELDLGQQHHDSQYLWKEKCNLLLKLFSGGRQSVQVLQATGAWSFTYVSEDKSESYLMQWYWLARTTCWNLAWAVWARATVQCDLLEPFTSGALKLAVDDCAPV